MAMDNLNKSLSTGSTWKDLMLGGLGGLASQLDKGKGNYYVMANYKGNGLADSGMGYLTNYDYKNPYDMVNMVASVWGDNKDLPSSISGRIKNKLGDLFGGMTREDVYNNETVFNHDIMNTTGYKIPKKLSFLGPNIVGQPTTVNNKGYGYSLPTQNYNYNSSWLKK